ncbi:S8 family peptidase [Hymenobacter saemangeumensis]|uniref:S8 family peptidase n=1 Tax=Hymenobacter saemangeumensis TaxID=1084522 RepID=A0ABP8ISC0_9BACT
MTHPLSRLPLPALLALTLLSACARRPQAGTPVASTAVSTPVAPVAPDVPARPATPPPPVEFSSSQWYLKDPQLDNVPGASVTRSYAELLKGKTPTPVVVAVIDSGIDTAHVDLKPILWRNTKEIAGNGLDDDKNGYIDDVYGWNFLGGADGRNIDAETLESTRIIARFDPIFKGKTRKQVKPTQLADFDLYERAKKSNEARRKEVAGQMPQIEQMDEMARNFEELAAALKQDLGTDRLDTATLRRARPSDPRLAQVTRQLDNNLRSMNFGDVDVLIGEMKNGAKYVRTLLNYQLNPSFNPRADIVKDNPDDVSQRFYGNADVHGPDPLHGTHVSGIIAAVRDNNLGVQGVAGPLVRIMAVRAVPDGDERDKDIANAIRYAVDNGAQIINMSFGKEFSTQRKMVEEAYKYAASKNVLLVHAAGNEDDDLGVAPHYPSAFYLDGKPVPHLLTVGASGPSNDASLVGDFSNYSRKAVDVFAPGVQIFNTLPGSKYGNESGTSMAAPVTAGVAATLKSYFPTLTAADLKRIIRESAQVYHTKVSVPGTQKTADFSTLSSTGGIVNLYEAIKLAQKSVQ